MYVLFLFIYSFLLLNLFQQKICQLTDVAVNKNLEVLVTQYMVLFDTIIRHYGIPEECMTVVVVTFCRLVRCKGTRALKLMQTFLRSEQGHVVSHNFLKTKTKTKKMYSLQ